ncbi:aspartate-semialdehyde dehydrogenase [Stutzerimonas nitrititolerans]|uniref:aspartate-semialdehyde dehydrogenase n=1 Tax=Stutzerimonas nitrititolerans TaxID=2482751 RepID=UPI0028980490|nr:aspartate-semialdehyde dehydrogenase [Stutzerimonas nitrititolerans]
MLPPIPSGVIQVTAQQDVVKPRPNTPPVTPVQASANESAISPDRRHPQEAVQLQRDERRRRQRRARSDGELVEDEVETDDVAELDELPRQGRWVDVEV